MVGGKAENARRVATPTLTVMFLLVRYGGGMVAVIGALALASREGEVV